MYNYTRKRDRAIFKADNPRQFSNLMNLEYTGLKRVEIQSELAFLIGNNDYVLDIFEVS